MFRFILAIIAVVVLLVAAGSASAHGGQRARDFNDGFEAGLRAARGVHHFSPRNFGPRVNPFNQDGGPNRIGRRR